MIGTVPLTSFIYMIMSILIICGMTFNFVKWTQAATGAPLKYAPVLRPGLLPERDFEKILEEYYPRDPDTPPTPAYAETIEHDTKKGISSQDLRECRELIRAKFALDVDVYNLQDVDEMHWSTVEDKVQRSKGAMIDIRKKINAWKTAKDQWTAVEWAMVEELHYRISGPHPEAI
ncbi:hypothetical protein BGZ60DRAFT_402680 [Tricladium varicosporioides]|nr:hypothetical protein BGZ60DRAFT_402680 [Hymenoscyphus varicosporioides]